MKPSDSLEEHTKVTLQSLWSASGGDWSSFLEIVDTDVKTAVSKPLRTHYHESRFVLSESFCSLRALDEGSNHHR